MRRDRNFKFQISNLKFKRGLVPLLLILGVALLGSIVVLILVVNQGKFGKLPESLPIPSVDKQIINLQRQSHSDEVPAVEKDLKNTNISDLDQGIDEVDQAVSGL
jgi:hypothetical protein